MPNGSVKWFSEGRGQGIISADLDKKELSVSFKDLIGPGFKMLFPGQRVSFEIVDTGKGLSAIQVMPTDDI